MGSADHQFHLTELLTQNYSLQEGCAEALQGPDRPEEELDKDFIDQVWGLTRLSHCTPWLHVVQPHAQGLHCAVLCWPSLRACCVCTAHLLRGPHAGVLSCGDLLRNDRGPGLRVSGTWAEPRASSSDGPRAPSQSSDMPLDELLALYGYESSEPISEQESEGGDTAPPLPDMTLDKVSGSLPKSAQEGAWLS